MPTSGLVVNLNSVCSIFFGGPGSTMIAFLKTGRAACLIEFDPRYVGVIVRCWQVYSGERTVRESNELSSDEVALSMQAESVAIQNLMERHSLCLKKVQIFGVTSHGQCNALYVLMVDQGMKFVVALPHIWDPETQALFAAVMSFWFDGCPINGWPV